jgi:TolB-like protein
MTEVNKAVFLSYASQDAEPAGKICATLRTAGIEVWFDQSELRGGDVWDQAIHRQIRDCALFIPVISTHTQSRLEGYFRREWKLAVARTQDMADERRFLVPVVLDGTNQHDAAVPEVFRAVQWTRLPGGETSPAFCERIAGLLGSPVPLARPQSIATAVSAAELRRPSKRWMMWTALAALIVAVIGWQAWRGMRPMRVTGISQAAALAAPDKSIAVLPFVDMSEKHDQEYFSDGLSEELIDHLSHNPNLKVIARTSSFAFKGKNEDMRTIATKLGVANLLEGSVRKAGTELRITAQLIRATDGVHLWSQTYERKLSDIFKVQDEISTTVAQELNVALGETSRPVTGGMASIAAYNLMLQGNYFFYRDNKGDTDRAIEFYRQVTVLEPRNALAWARIAEAYVALGSAGHLSLASARSQARTAMQRALAIDPDLARAHFVLGNMHRDLELDWDAAKVEYERAVALDARGDVASDARFNASAIDAFKSGRVDALLYLVTQDIARNPLSATNFDLLGVFQYAAGHLEESAAAFRKLLELDPNYEGAHSDYALTLLAMGKSTESLAVAEQESDELAKLSALPCIYWEMGRRGESDVAMKKLEDRHGNYGTYAAALNHACRGEVDLAFEWLERAYENRDGDLETIKIHPLLRSLHGDPRFKAFLRKLNYPET